MAASMAASMAGGAVNVKAGTNEECDAIGRGEAIAAHATLLLLRDDRAPATAAGPVRDG
jgi:2C-methyl-D-erythritol 2,4-cyclodiphosphate synthase